MSTTMVDGLSIAYRQQGSGPPLLLLHSVFTDSRIWERQIDELSRSFTVLAWDTPGCGGSDDPPEGWTMADYAAALHGLVTAVGFKRPHIVASAWGAGLALEYYRAHPGEPRTLVLTSAYAGWKGSLPQDETDRRLERIRAESQLPPEAFIASWIPTLLAPSASKEIVEQVTSLMRDSHPDGPRRMSEAFAQSDTRDILSSIEVPTLLVYGAADRRSPLTVAKELNDAIPGSELVVLPSVGHLVFVEDAAGFNAAVLRFLGAGS